MVRTNKLSRIPVCTNLRAISHKLSCISYCFHLVRMAAAQITRISMRKQQIFHVLSKSFLSPHTAPTNTYLYAKSLSRTTTMGEACCSAAACGTAQEKDAPNLVIFYSIKIILAFITMNCGRCAAPFSFSLCTFKRKTSPHSLVIDNNARGCGIQYVSWYFAAAALLLLGGFDSRRIFFLLIGPSIAQTSFATVHNVHFRGAERH